MRTEPITLRYDDGSPRETYAVYAGKDGEPVRHGICRVYWGNGAPAAELRYVHGTPRGRHVRWYPNGVRALDVTLDDEGKASGKELKWYPNSCPKAECMYRDGWRVGVAGWWNDKGELIAQGEYRPITITVGGRTNWADTLDIDQGTREWNGTFLQRGEDGSPGLLSVVSNGVLVEVRPWTE